MEICPPEKLTNVSHFISRGLFRNYKKDAAARRAATSMFWFKENQRPVPLIRASRNIVKTVVILRFLYNLAFGTG